MKIIKNIFLIAISVCIFACNNDDYTGDAPNTKQLLLKVNARGTVLGQPKTIVHPKTGETLEPTCFLMDLVDPDTGKLIGTLQDCVVSMETPSDGTITSKVITSIHIDGRGTILAENIVFQELRPPAQELNFNTSFTPTKNNVIYTTFEFEGMEGTVSLDGEVNLSKLGEGIVTFNCDFTINLQSN
ncbi:hypothetical protein [Kriegella aquimaris]|uniref:Lipid/polyisoprenoid-binding YceI-like domain-containing protein n=1 Tax=Kriegella aquimaris TaxID=192904 RepID=A0A1G9S8Y3_9FLAO|nr:hypothetical protein [Kriegella aquimaris]SDM31831.1 hypothetical protein SAMN04488514_107164 [Kriegella aquimaris]